MVCVIEHTNYNVSVGGTTLCQCKPGYVGTYCETYNDHKIPLKWVLRIILTFGVALPVIIWMIVRLIDLHKQKKLMFNLLMISMVMNIISVLIDTTVSWIPSDSIRITEDTLYVIMIFAIVFVYSGTILRLAATSLIVGFWFEVLTRKMSERKQVFKTKIIVIVSSVVLICCAIIAICVVLSNISLLLLAIALIYIPLIIDIIVTTVLSFGIKKLKTSNTSSRNASRTTEKKEYVAKILVTICCIWLLCVLLIITSLAIGYTSAKIYNDVVSFFNTFFQAVISIMLMLLFDYKAESGQRIFLGKSASAGSDTNTTNATSKTNTITRSRKERDENTVIMSLTATTV